MSRHQKFGKKETPLIYAVPSITFEWIDGTVQKEKLRDATPVERMEYLKTHQNDKQKKVKVLENIDTAVRIPLTCWHFDGKDIGVEKGSPRNCYPPSIAVPLAKSMVKAYGMRCTQGRFAETFVPLAGNRWYPKDIPFEPTKGQSTASHTLATRLEAERRFCLKEEDYNRVMAEARQPQQKVVRVTTIKIGVTDDFKPKKPKPE